MGSTFHYIADAALRLADTEDKCDRCGEDTTSYEIAARLDQDDRFEDHVLCPKCIHDIPLRQLRPQRSELGLQAEINRHHPKGTLTGEQRLNRTIDICDGSRRIPRMFMFIQSDAWPTCCGDLTEFIGDSPADGCDYGDYDCWDDPDSFVAQFKLSDFYPLSKLEVLKSMSLFHCLHCSSKYWVFQYSGLFWPGPIVDGTGTAETA